MKKTINYLATVLILAACSSSGSNNENESALIEDVPVETSHTVIIEQMKFIPEELKVSPGDTVIFLNKDIVPHDATQNDKKWGSPTLNTGDSWSFVPEESTDYYCSIHIVMKGKIIME